MRRRLALLGMTVLTLLTVTTTGANATTNTANNATFSAVQYILLDIPMGCC
jgi:hypothetical protein